MSDGNYNRNLLPYRDYQSGLRAGRAQALVKAIHALKDILESSTIEEQEREKLLSTFRIKLEQ